MKKTAIALCFTLGAAFTLTANAHAQSPSVQKTVDFINEKLECKHMQLAMLSNKEVQITYRDPNVPRREMIKLRKSGRELFMARESYIVMKRFQLDEVDMKSDGGSLINVDCKGDSLCYQQIRRSIDVFDTTESAATAKSESHHYEYKYRDMSNDNEVPYFFKRECQAKDNKVHCSTVYTRDDDYIRLCRNNNNDASKVVQALAHLKEIL